MRLTLEELKPILDRQTPETRRKILDAIQGIKDDSARRSKYGSRRVTLEDAESFDSEGEYKRYCELVLLERACLISELRRQVEFKIKVNGFDICSYFADFVYDQEGKTIVEDFKSIHTRKLPVYRLKLKLMKAVFGVTIYESGIEGKKRKKPTNERLSKK